MTADALWELLADTDRYPQWWSWLRRFDLDGDGLEAGSVATCQVRAPLPYSLHFDVAVDEAVPASRVVTTVSGDLAGPARLEIEPHGASHCAARLVWEVHLEDRVLRRLAIVARPGMVWAHDRVVNAGIESFGRNVGGHGT